MKITQMDRDRAKWLFDAAAEYIHTRCGAIDQIEMYAYALAKIDKCDVCDKRLRDAEDEEASNSSCGGTCLRCMAVIGGDPDCIKRLSDLGNQEGIKLQKQLEYEAST